MTLLAQVQNFSYCSLSKDESQGCPKERDLTSLFLGDLLLRRFFLLNGHHLSKVLSCSLMGFCLLKEGINGFERC